MFGVEGPRAVGGPRVPGSLHPPYPPAQGAGVIILRLGLSFGHHRQDQRRRCRETGRAPA